jgi:hypothetical protein
MSSDYQGLTVMIGSPLWSPGLTRGVTTSMNVGRVHYLLTTAPSAQFRRWLVASERLDKAS